MFNNFAAKINQNQIDFKTIASIAEITTSRETTGIPIRTRAFNLERTVL
jgi:hypothetical protein